MSLLMETTASVLNAAREISYAEIYVRGMPYVLVYATLQLLSLGIINCSISVYLIAMATIEWPLVLPIYLYAVYKYKIKIFIP